MRHFYLIFLCTGISLLSPQKGIAQYQEDSTMVLLLEKMGTQRGVWFSPGDTIRYRLVGSKEWTKQVLERFTEDGDLRFTIDTVALKDIDALEVMELDRTRRRNHAYGKTLFIAAGGYLLIDQVNEIIRGNPPTLNMRVLRNSGIIVAGGTLLLLRGRPIQRIRGRWRLRITPLPQRFVIGRR